ncbi:HNH endonuclease signature motif containing protein [Microbacterium sp. ASV81]|uniref:DUF222 domain-containing protein n=1 Tax=Microbacterium capsulatum TaxID=3041921 RepID=A0ABU0XCP8_9MICO|nr:DUF222 domain-containing protein [Microbacterium sp. ASV81]MDQ4212889.1 DUF222 domain-containing protein [Microbacterium sp. ASV81]
MSNLTPPPLANRDALLDEWVQTRAEIARLEGRAADLLGRRSALFDDDVREHPHHRDVVRRSMIAEYAAAGHLAKGTVELAFADAEAMAERFPELHAALREGRVSSAHVREVVNASAPVRHAVVNRRLGEEAFALYEAAVLTVAEQDSPSRTRVHARQVAAALAQESLRERHERAAEERCVTIRPLEDGLALLTAVLPEVYAVAIHDRLTRLARSVMAAPAHGEATADLDHPQLEGPDFVPEPLGPVDDELGWFAKDDLSLLGIRIPDDASAFMTDPADPDLARGASGSPAEADPRTMDQVRADVLADLLLAAAPSSCLGEGLDRITAHVQVTVAATTLLGADDRLAELDGHGPLHPDLARELAGRASGWSRLFLDPTGMVTETDGYTPTASMRRYLRARDQRCRFPGCGVPPSRCDVDHNLEHSRGGPTDIGNLSHFCRAHHALKHPDIDDAYRWTALTRPGGIVDWISPLGRSHLDRAPRRVMFV